MISVILTVAVLFTIFFKAEVPGLSGDNGFWALLLAQFILILAAPCVASDKAQPD